MTQKPKYCKRFETNSHWRKLSMIIVWAHYCNASPKPESFFIFFVYNFCSYLSYYESAWVEISTDDSPYIDTSKLMYNWSFLFVVLHIPRFWPSTFNFDAVDLNGPNSQRWFISNPWIIFSPWTTTRVKQAWCNTYNNWSPMMTTRRSKTQLFWAYFSPWIYINHRFE